MLPMLPIAIFSMIAALACYSVGVWSEKLTGRLKTWHTAFFWVGFIFDTTGTTLMADIAGKMDFDLHGVTGALAGGVSATGRSTDRGRTNAAST